MPATLACVLRLEKKGHGGKTVTVVDGLPQNTAFLWSLASELKRACGTGGTVGEGRIEIQGDQRERVEVFLAARRLRWKRAGG